MKYFENEIDRIFEESIKVKQETLKQKKVLIEAINALVECLKNGNKVLVCGNGGSAADAQHIAGELVGRFKMQRRGYPAIALTTDSSVLTAWGNDYGFDTVFARQVEALGMEGDILICISTSGNSKNIIEAIKKSKSKKIKTIGLLGSDGGKMKNMCDISVIIPSKNTPRIQESHLLVYHIMCELIERELQ